MNVSSLANTPPCAYPSRPPAAAPERHEHFQLDVLDHSREMYFLPGIDRLAVTLAARSEVPLHVKVEVEGQYLEYTLDSRRPEAPIQGSFNGKPFQMTSKPGEEGKRDYELRSSAGNVFATLYPESEGSGFSAIVENPEDRVPISQRMNLDPNHKGSLPQGTIIGNFSCSRLHEDLVQEGDQLKISGVMGAYDVGATLSPGPNGTLINVGFLDDVEFRQTFTPVKPGS